MEFNQLPNEFYPTPLRYDRNSIEQGMTLTGIEQVLNEVPTVQPVQKVEIGEDEYKAREAEYLANKKRLLED